MAYTNVSDEFKEIVKSNSITASAKIVIPSLNITILPYATDDIKSSLAELTIEDKCCDNGKYIGNAVSKKVELSIINKDNLDLADREFELYVGVKLSNGEYEYIPYGNFIVTAYTDTKSNNKFKIEAYDYMTKLNGYFSNILYNEKTNPNGLKIDYPIKLKAYKEKILTYMGISYINQTLPNDNFSIDTAINFDGYTIRNVIAKIAELQGTFARINRENKMEFCLQTQTDEEIPLSSMNNKQEINNRYGPVNVVSLTMKNVKGENVTLRDEDSIAKYGETTIEIQDNPFVYTEALREKAINELYNALKDFSYYPINFNWKARLYTDGSDIIKVYDMRNKKWVNSIVMNQTIKIPATRQSTLESPALTKTQVANQYISQSKQANTRTEIMVDKQEQKIQSVVNSVTEQNNKISQITQTVDEVNSKISDIADITTYGESDRAEVELTDVNESEPVMVKVHPTSTNISYLYPRENLYPSDTQYLPDRIIRFTNTEKYRLTQDLYYNNFRKYYSYNSTDDEYILLIAGTDYTVGNSISGDVYENVYIDYPLPDDLLRYSSEVYDEFYLDYDSHTCQVIKRCAYNADGTVRALGTKKTTDYEYPTIKLGEGNYTITLPGYDYGYLYARLMAKNIYTTQFYTKVETSSKINQKADEINAEVRKKVGNDELISKINQSADRITLSAGRLVINSGNFILDENGNVKCTNGEFQGTITSSNATITGGSLKVGKNFSVDKDGKLTCSNANVTGDITSSNATITGGSLKVGKNFSVDKDGNVNVANLVTTGKGVYTNIHVNSLTYFGYESMIGGLQTLGFEYNMDVDDIAKDQLIFYVYIPTNFTITEAYINLIHVPILWRYSNDTDTVWGYTRNIGLYKGKFPDNEVRYWHSEPVSNPLLTPTKINMFANSSNWHPENNTTTTSSHKKITTTSQNIWGSFNKGPNIFILQSDNSEDDLRARLTTDRDSELATDKNCATQTGKVIGFLDIYGYLPR